MTDRVDKNVQRLLHMLEGIKRQAPRVPRGRVAQTVGDEPMAELVQRDAQKRRNRAEQNVQQRGKIKTV